MSLYDTRYVLYISHGDSCTGLNQVYNIVLFVDVQWLFENL